MTTEAQLRQRVRNAHGFFRELIDLTEIQGWMCRVKEDGLLFFPPPDKRRPGMESVYARDPGNESHSQKQIRDRFRKAGLVFPDEQPPERKPKAVMATTTHTPSSTAAPTPTANPFALIRQKISSTVNLLSEIEQLLGKIEVDDEHARKIKEMLKGLVT